MIKYDGDEIKGFIFDLDGTLVDSMVMWEDIVPDLLKKYGIDSFEEGLIEKLEPLFMDEMAEYISKNFEINKTTNEILSDVDKMVSDGYKYKVEFKLGALEFIKKYELLGIKMCILSTTDRKYIVDFLKSKNMLDKFEFVSCASESGFSKEYIAPYEMARKKLGFKLDEVVVFEDATYAIKTLHSNLYKVVCVYDANAKDHKLNKKLSNQYVVNLNECNFVE